MKTKLAVVGAAFVTVFVVVGLAVGGWNGFWWMQGASLKHQLPLQNQRARNVRAGYEFQTTMRTEIEQKITDIRDIDSQITQANSPDTKTALQAQRMAIISQTCQLADQLQGGDVPQVISSFISADCQIGAP